jgi:hypothetical protein
VNDLPPGALRAESVQLRVQLHQVALSLRLLAPGLGLALSETHAHACAHALQRNSEACTPSAMHSEVSLVLRALGLRHDNELVVPGLGYVVDIAAAGADGSHVAIEVNGPDHYLPCGALNPQSALKYAHLRAAGWCVLTVRNSEWLACPSDEARSEMLLALVEDEVSCDLRQRGRTAAAGQSGVAAAARGLVGSLRGLRTVTLARVSTS